MLKWTSPDNKIEKEILTNGVFGQKPSECCNCDILITDCPDNLKHYKSVTIGDNDGDIGRFLDICLTTMNVKELSRFIIHLETEDISFVVELVRFSSEGFIFEWDAFRKYKIVLDHKNKGVELFKACSYKDASFRFIKAIKILNSIPIDVETNTIVSTDVTLENINILKENLYNNLSSCYFKNGAWLNVIDICKKVFAFDKDNVKALYKIGISYKNEKNYEQSYNALKKLLELEPNNKACSENLKSVVAQLKESETRVNTLVKNMFRGTCNS